MDRRRKFMAIGALTDASSTVRFNAAHALWGFGVKVLPALPAITNESTFQAQGNDDTKLGPKSSARIIALLPNALPDIRDHVERPY